MLDAATGNLKTRIYVAAHGHNTVCSLDGRWVYMGATRYPYLVVADTATNQIVKRVPVGEGVRPFTVNGSNTLAFVNVNYLLGFEVGDLRTSRRLFRVEIPGFPKPSTCTRRAPSHGVALTPNERQVWVTDGCYRYVHVFDVTGLPTTVPRKLASIKLINAEPPDGWWVSFSLDGRFAYVSSGEIFDVATRQRVATFPPASKFLEVDFHQGRPVRVGSRYGLGYVVP